jgi:hypothetical protein
MNVPTVEPMRSPRTGKSVANQFVIYDDTGVTFQSYYTVIAHRAFDGTVTLDPRWACSPTTSKWRNVFLGESTDATQKKIDSGEYRMEDLNNG